MAQNQIQTVKDGIERAIADAENHLAGMRAALGVLVSAEEDAQPDAAKPTTTRRGRGPNKAKPGLPSGHVMATVVPAGRPVGPTKNTAQPIADEREVERV